MLLDQKFKHFWSAITNDLSVRLKLLQERIKSSNDIALDCQGIIHRVRYIFYNSLQLSSPKFCPDMFSRIQSATHLQNDVSFRAIIANWNLDLLENITTINGTSSLLTYLIQTNNPKIVDIAIRAGATINDDGTRVSALPPLNACFEGVTEQNSKNREAMVGSLLAAGADPNLMDSRKAFVKHGRLSFRLAIVANISQTVVNRILVAGLEINISACMTVNHTAFPKATLHSPLSIACLYGKENLVKEFMYFGSDTMMEGVNLELFCSPKMLSLIRRLEAIRAEICLSHSDVVQKFHDSLPFIPKVLGQMILSYYDVYTAVFPTLTLKEKLTLVDLCREKDCAAEKGIE